MSHTIYDEECPRCKNQYGHMDVRNNTAEYWFNCFLCGYSNAKNLIPEYWELKEDVLTGDKEKDKKWYQYEEDIPLGAVEIWDKDGLGSYFTFNSEEELEGFKSDFTLKFNDPNGHIKSGNNILKEFRENKFFITNLETMTTIEYSAEDYFKELEAEEEKKYKKRFSVVNGKT